MAGLYLLHVVRSLHPQQLHQEDCNGAEAQSPPVPPSIPWHRAPATPGPLLLPSAPTCPHHPQNSHPCHPTMTPLRHPQPHQPVHSPTPSPAPTATHSPTLNTSHLPRPSVFPCPRHSLPLSVHSYTPQYYSEDRGREMEEEGREYSDEEYSPLWLYVCDTYLWANMHLDFDRANRCEVVWSSLSKLVCMLSIKLGENVQNDFMQRLVCLLSVSLWFPSTSD